MVRVLDLFSGMGGLSLGFLFGVRDVVVEGLDVDRFAVMTYNHNLNWLGGDSRVQDVLEWVPDGDYDIVVGGVPCQPYSLANVRKRGTKHKLFPTLPRFFDIVRVLKPKVFLMENVKGLVIRRHKPLLFNELRKVSGDYVVKYEVLNVAYYGVPQRRERLFVLGIRKDLGVVPSFPRQTHSEEERKTLNGKLFRWVTVREAIGDLLSIPPTIINKSIMFDEDSIWEVREKRNDVATEFKFRDMKPMDLDKPSRTITTDIGRNVKRPHNPVPIVTEHIMLENGGWDSSRSDWGSRVIPESKPSYTITEKHRSGQVVEVPSEAWLSKHPPAQLNKPSNSIASNTGKNKKVEGGRYRRLTVRECLRLQSFPDWYSFPVGVSVSRKYKLVGEAVPPILAYRLARHIGLLMGWRVNEPQMGLWRLPYYDRAFQDFLNEDRV